jgi:D-alanyl-D-alanine dipeptidase
MEEEGFEVYDWEWWHFDFRDWKRYRIHGLSFEDIQRGS